MSLKIRTLKRCCIPDCKDRTSKRHRFPNPNRYPEYFCKWLDIIKPKNYEILPTKRIYDIYFVCDSHFEPDCLVTGVRGLKTTAVPTLNMPGIYIYMIYKHNS